MAERLILAQRRASRKEFHIMKGEEVVAHLRFVSIWTNRAEGSYGKTALDFSLEGFLRNKAVVSDHTFGQIIASARLGGWFGKQAEIELQDGRMLTLSSKGVLHRIWTLSETGSSLRKELLTFSEKRGIIRDEGTIDLGEFPLGGPDPLLLALLVCYLVVVVHEQEGAVAATGGT